MARDLILISGNRGCYWDDLARYYFRFKSQVEWAWRGASRLMIHRQYYQLLSENSAIPLRTLLEWSRYGKCHDVRDKVYALMALATPATTHTSLRGYSRSAVAQSSEVWKADYTISRLHLYWRALSHVGLVESHLDDLEDRHRRPFSRKSKVSVHDTWREGFVAQLNMALEINSDCQKGLLERLSATSTKSAIREYYSRIQGIPSYRTCDKFRSVVHPDLQLDMEYVISETLDPVFGSNLDYENNKDWGIFCGIISAVSKWGSKQK